MPYKDKAKQLSYQNNHLKSRRVDWLSKNGPCIDCGSTEKLMVTRKDFSKSADSHLWSYTESRRDILLRSFVVRCRACARRAINSHLRDIGVGRRGTGSTKLRNQDVWAIRGRLLGKESIRNIARDFGIVHQVVQSIQRGTTFSWLTPGKRLVAGLEAAPFEPVEKRKYNSGNKKTRSTF